MKNRFSLSRGFSLIEILIAIFIFGLLLAIGFLSYRFFEYGTELDIEAQSILAISKLAQTKTLASEGASQYGVHFEADKYVFFKGDTYIDGAADNEVHQLPSRLDIYSIVLNGGGNDVIFERISGITNQDGTIGLQITSDPSQTKTINISPFGKIELGASLPECCTTNRVTDYRHIHLDLDWSIQNANTLILDFFEAPQQENITMTDYFNGDQTEFDWSGIIDVNGQNQELHIHTYYLDEFDTILCIHRDMGENNEPLQITIVDEFMNKDIISYNADGSISILSGGGEEEIQ